MGKKPYCVLTNVYMYETPKGLICKYNAHK